jgi:hypothetical protein
MTLLFILEGSGKSFMKNKKVPMIKTKTKTKTIPAGIKTFLLKIKSTSLLKNFFIFIIKNLAYFLIPCLKINSQDHLLPLF